MTKAPEIRSDGLQITEHSAFQNRFWKIERWAWAGFALIILVALLGLTGAGGPLADAKTSVGGALVQYPRVARWQTGTRMVVSFPVATSGSTIAFSHAHGDSFVTEGVLPQAEHVIQGAGDHVYTFRTAHLGKGRVVFDLTARGPGVARYDVVIAGERRRLTTLILP